MKFQNKHEFAAVFFLQCLDIVKMVFYGVVKAQQELLIYVKHVKGISVYITVTKLFCTTLDISLDICNCRSLISMGHLFSRRRLISRKGFECHSILELLAIE